MITTRYKLNTPCRIALLTDMHNQEQEDALRSLRREKPDIVCVAGDLVCDNFVSSFEKETNILPFLRACAGEAPTYFSFGNHEWCMPQDQIDIIKSLGVTVLDNEWIRCKSPRAGMDLLIGGLTPGAVTACRDPNWRSVMAQAGRKKWPPGPDLDWLADFESMEGFKLLLCHHPEYYPAYLIEKRIDLVLAGHAHGGQWRFFGRGLFAPGQGLLPKYTAGVYKGRCGRLVVSRGLSNTTMIPRLNNPCEVVIIE